MKRFLLFLSALFYSCLIFAEIVSIDGIQYDLDDTNKTAQVYEINEYDPAGIEIKEKVTYNGDEYTVTSLNEDAFDWCDNVVYISLPNTITKINDYQFHYLDKLEVVNLGNNVTYIGPSSFSYCMSLKTINIPETVTAIGYNAFYYCKSLKAINIPESVTEIGYRAFASCTSLTSVVIPNKVTEISYDTFEGCTALKSIKIGDSVTSLPEDFSSLTSLEEFIVSPENKKYSSENGILFSKDKTALLNCPLGIDCSSYQIPFNVETIYAYAFKEHKEITSIAFHDNINTIFDYAFENCVGLEKVEISQNVTSLGNQTFSGCTNFKEFIVDPNNNNYSSEDGVLYNKLKTILLRYPVGKQDESYILPNVTDTIGDAAFNNCSYLSNVILHDNIDVISSYVFRGSKLYEDESNWDNGVFYVGNYLLEADKDKLQADYVVREGTRIIANSAFSGCQKLNSIVLPNSLERIGVFAFYMCKKLKNINIGSNVSKIDSYAFYFCDNLCEINVSYDNEYFSSQDGVLFNKDKTELLQYPNAKENTSYTIPNFVKIIGQDAFSHCSNLTDITIPDGVVEIKYQAFHYCEGLTSIEIPNSVKYLGTAFQGCYDLKSITLGANIDSIGNDPFYGTMYYNDESNWENGVMYIGEYLIKANPKVIDSNYKVKEGTRLIADLAFYDCDNMVNVEIPNSVTRIGMLAFEYCDNLKSVYIPRNINRLQIGTFWGCSALTSIAIPSNVKILEGQLFQECENLNEIFIYSLEIPEVYPYTFTDDWKYDKYTFLYDRVDLYVPCEVLEDYKSHEIFGQFKNIKCIGAEQTELEEEDVKIDVDENSVQISWPKVEGANSYTVIIKQDDNTVYEIEFDAEGNVISINTVSDRSATIGFTYNVPNLKPGTKYSYSVIANDVDNTPIEIFTGEFSTLGEYVAIDEIFTQLNIFVEEGTIKCETEDFVIYNTIGQDVTALNGSLQPGVYVLAVNKEVFKVIVK